MIRGSPDHVAEALKEMIKDMEPSKIITVGDSVSETLAKKVIFPDVLIVDNKIMRSLIKPIEVDADETLHLRNPAGTITDEAWRVVKEVLQQQKKTVKIVVEGEEDLLTLTAVLFAPENSIVIYGQPHEGAVVIKVTEETRSLVSRLISEMKHQN